MKSVFFVTRFCLVASIILLYPWDEAQAATIDVDCPPDSLQAAITAAAPGDTIRIAGNCVQNPIITTDKLTLTSKNNSSEGIDGFVLVTGARGTTFTNITVKNGNGSGIVVSEGGSLTLNGVTSSGHSRAGVFVLEKSLAKIFGGTITGNSRNGVSVQQGSHVTISNVMITANGRSGVRGASASSVDIVNSTTISSNGRHGVEMVDNSFAAVESSHISGNTRRAVSVADSGFVGVEDSVVLSDIPDSAPNRGGILANRGAVLWLRGGNIITNTADEAGGGRAVEILAGSFLRQGTGLDTITSTNG